MSYTGFRLVPTSLTLNDLERRNTPYFAFFLLNSIALHTDYVTQNNVVFKLCSIYVFMYAHSIYIWHVVFH